MEMSAATADKPTVIIQPSTGWVPVRIRELLEYYELLYFLALREIKVRYKQTAIGAAWAIIQPLFTVLLFSLFFGRLAKMPSDGIPYPVFNASATVPWTFFMNGLTQASMSLVNNSNLISKVYFPRLIIPIASVLSGVVDFAIAFALLLILMLYYGIHITASLVFFPLFLLLALITSLGVGLWFAALNVEYRDVRYVVPFLSQLWMYATPVIYPSSLLREPWKTVYGLNPMVGVVEGFRWALLGTKPPGPMLIVSAAMSIVVLIGGAFYFRRMERGFADLI